MPRKRFRSIVSVSNANELRFKSSTCAHKATLAENVDKKVLAQCYFVRNVIRILIYCQYSFGKHSQNCQHKHVREMGGQNSEINLVLQRLTEKPMAGYVPL